ncbi:MAG: sigma-70 family RNA polymerase sigma factor [Planctomycetes bacterium]|nr:sigma-70 family RNA polymerase sigma factor [Planctomycetota bacterium]
MEALELIAQIRSGRGVKAAQDRLYGLVEGALLERLRTKIPPRLRPRMDAEDVVQIAFLKAMEALEGFEPRSADSFFAWVYRIAKNLIADQAKRRSAAAAHLVRGEETGGVRESGVPGRATRPESLVGRRELIESLLGRLDEKEAEVIRLRDLEGKTYEEIGAAWRKTPGAVQRFHSRAWQRLCAIAQRDET